MESLLAHCTAAFSQHSNIFVLFFMGGLTGAITHCLLMCGPIAAAQTACAKACAGGCTATTSSKLMRAAVLPYHLGRATTYGALGFLAALVAKQVAAYSFWPTLTASMLLAAGLLFLFSSLPNCKHPSFHFSPKSTYLRGVLLGFMPCGLLYAALMMAATLADPLSGMVAMWLFTLGTMPVLLLASGGAAYLSKKWVHLMPRVGRVMMAFNGLTLMTMALRGMR